MPILSVEVILWPVVVILPMSSDTTQIYPFSRVLIATVSISVYALRYPGFLYSVRQCEKQIVHDRSWPLPNFVASTRKEKKLKFFGRIHFLAKKCNFDGSVLELGPSAETLPSVGTMIKQNSLVRLNI